MQSRDLNMIVGCDLDALMSASLLTTILNCHCIGFYDFTSVFLEPGISIADARDAVWVDLDINQTDIRSIGHHILTRTPDETLSSHRQSLNPNLLRRISVEDFDRENPFATIHLLMWLLEWEPQESARVVPLLWLPDSVWIVAQLYKKNVKEWLANWLSILFLIDTQPEIDSSEFEDRLKNLYMSLDNVVTLKAGRAQKKSKRSGLKGRTYSFRNPSTNSTGLTELLAEIGKILDLNTPELPASYDVLSGQREEGLVNPKEVIDTSPATFSYVHSSREKGRRTRLDFGNPPDPAS